MNRRARLAQRAYVTAFVAYVAVVLLWLSLGLVSAVAERSPSLRGELIRWEIATETAPWLRSLARGLRSAPGADESMDAGLWLDYSFSVFTIALALLLVRARPRHPVVRLLSFAMIGTSAAFNLTAHRALDVLSIAYGVNFEDLHLLLLHCVAGVAYVYALLLFPDGRLLPSRLQLPSRVLALARVGWLVVANFLLLQAALITGTDHRAFFVVFYGVVAPATGLVAQRRRYQRAGTAAERAQCRLVLAALVTALVAAFLVAVPILLLDSRTLSVTAEESLVPISFGLFRAVFSLIPVALVVGIVRFRLWEIDTLLTRALVVSGLGVVTGLGFIAAVVALPALVGDDGSIGLLGSAAVAAVVAVAIQPIRELVRRGANRLVYGRRPSPFELVGELARLVDEAVSIEHVVPRLAELTARAVGARTVRIHLWADRPPESPWPPVVESPDSTYVVPVRYDGRMIAVLEVEMSAGDRLSDRERRLLSSVASQSGLALHNVELVLELRQRLVQVQRQATELRASRRRLAAATDAERERLQVALEETPQRRLTALLTGIDKLNSAVVDGSEEATALIDDLEAQSRVLLDELRALARGIYPPLLADRGVQTALSSILRKLDIDSVIDVGAGLGAFRVDAAAETAVYFSCVDAVQAAGAGVPIGVQLAVEDDHLVFAVGSADRVPDLSPEDRLEVADRLAAVGGSLDPAALSPGTPLGGRVPALPG